MKETSQCSVCMKLQQVQEPPVSFRKITQYNKIRGRWQFYGPSTWDGSIQRRQQWRWTSACWRHTQTSRPCSFKPVFETVHLSGRGVFMCSDTGIRVSHPSRGMYVCQQFFCFVLCRAGGGLATGLIPHLMTPTTSLQDYFWQVGEPRANMKCSKRRSNAINVYRALTHPLYREQITSKKRK
jgi:hypothetical protein